MQMKRIMWICHWESPFINEWKGGMGVYMFNVGRELRRHGYAIDVYTTRRDGRPTVQELAPDFRVIRVDVDGMHEDIRNSDHMHAFSDAVKNYVRRNHERYLLAHAHYFSSHSAGETMRSEGLPYILQLHQLYKPRPALFAEAGKPMETPINPTFFEHEMASVEEADRVIFVSNAQKEVFRKHYYDDQMPKAVDDKIVVIHNGIDTKHFRPATESKIRRLKERYIQDADAHVIGFVGWLSPLKAADMILDGFVELPPELQQKTYVTITGKGPDLGYLKARATELGINQRVRDFGYRTGQGLLDRYQMADLGVIPSVWETFGLCPTEFMSCGKPIIVRKGSGGPEEVAGDTGITFSTPKELADKITMLLNDKNEREHLGKRARKRAVNEFDISYTGENLATEYRMAA